MFDDVLGSPAEILERMAVRRECDRDVGHVGHPSQRAEEEIERIGLGRQPTDVRCDRREYVVAGEHDSEFGVVQAEMVVGVTGGVHRHPFPPRQLDRLPVDQRPRGLRRREGRLRRSAARSNPLDELWRGTGAAASPRRRLGEPPLHRRVTIVGRVDVELLGVLVVVEARRCRRSCERSRA